MKNSKLSCLGFLIAMTISIGYVQSKHQESEKDMSYHVSTEMLGGVALYQGITGEGGGAGVATTVGGAGVTAGTAIGWIGWIGPALTGGAIGTAGTGAAAATGAGVGAAIASNPIGWGLAGVGLVI